MNRKVGSLLAVLLSAATVLLIIIGTAHPAPAALAYAGGQGLLSSPSTPEAVRSRQRSTTSAGGTRPHRTTMSPIRCFRLPTSKNSIQAAAIASLGALADLPSAKAESRDG